ncbi:hypothetical protein TNCV_4914041 [Trichonephila clavipes]|nr:hypothetical protein TNCV_4914041 [Trichonephila clavipes]
MGSVVLWAYSLAQELENISLPFSSLAEIVEVEIEVVLPSIVPSGSFTELKSHCHLRSTVATLPDSIDHPIAVMTPSSMQNTTLVMPRIEVLS